MADKGLEDVPEGEFHIFLLPLVRDACVSFTCLPAQLDIEQCPQTRCA